MADAQALMAALVAYSPLSPPLSLEAATAVATAAPTSTVVLKQPSSHTQGENPGKPGV